MGSPADQGQDDSGVAPIRRLAAIVVADIVGYSRQMEADESGTLDRLQALHAELVRPKTLEFRGRIVKRMGDGWLAEFPSATDAVRSSVEIQERAAARNARSLPDHRLELRIGVNLGEIIFDGDDVFGNGVNIAARLESIATPGQVCISSSVHEQVRGVLDVACEDMGEHVVKNIARPIRCFAIQPGDGGFGSGPTGSERAVAAATRGVSIAVLPFDNLSGDPTQDYFADGMVEDIITALSRFKWLKVIARNSTFVYKGRAVDVRQVAKDLGVRYVLEGSVQRSERRVRITGQLIDATTGAHLWAERFDGELESIFDLQDRITASVVAAIEPQIRKAEIERTRRKHPENLDAYDLFLQATPLAYAMRPDDCAKSLALLERSLRLDPGFVPAKAFVAWCYEQRLSRGWPSVEQGDAANAVRLAREVLAADTDDANAIAIAGFVLVMVGREFDVGLAALRRAVGLNRNNAFVSMNAGWGNAFAGDVGEALVEFERARRLNPQDPAAFYILTGLGAAHLFAGDHDRAADYAEQSAALYGEWDATYIVLAAALAYAGRIDEARRAIARLKLLLPGASIAVIKNMVPVRDARRLALWLEGLRRAGLPE
jgi:adenylate cyclase